MSAAVSIRAEYFPGLDSLRFLAAFAVIVHHIRQAAYMADVTEDFDLTYAGPLARVGPLGVTFFFVLSGFLITFLLLKEREGFGRISIPKFYVRRILRIWPVYLLVTIISFFILPKIGVFNYFLQRPMFDENFYPNLLLYLGFSAHMAVLIYPGIPVFASILWSVSVEEWFYLVWPWVASCGQKCLLIVSVLIILVFNGLRIVETADLIASALELIRFDSMAVGTLTALCMINYQTSNRLGALVTFLFRRDVQGLLISGLCYAILSGFSFGTFNHFCYSVLFAYVVFNVASNPKALFKMENQILRWLGQISYGLYCYQWIASIIGIWLCVLIFQHYKVSYPLVMIYPACFILTVLLATTSYYFLERPFLKLKAGRFSPLKANTSNPA